MYQHKMAQRNATVSSILNNIDASIIVCQSINGNNLFSPYNDILIHQ